MMKKATKEAVMIARYMSDFLDEYVPSQKSSSGHTLKSYNFALSLYIGFLETEKGIYTGNLRRECFSREYIEEWLIWLVKKRGCSPQTCNNRLSSLRVFLKYLVARDISFISVAEDASRISRRRETHKKVKGMSKNAVQALLSAPDLSTKTGRRDMALIVTMYGTAARLDEILSIKIGHLNLDTKKPNVSIVGKGCKIRTMYLLPKAVLHIRKYLKEFHGDTPQAESYVFYSRNIGPSGKMSQPAVNQQLKKHAQTAHALCNEVPLGLHAHQIRHAKASHWLDDGMNIVQISFLLGHEQLQTSMVYLDITTEQEAKALATLEDENDKRVSKKWKYDKGSLSELCGVKTMKK
jgi:site-specific recombinase XerD